MTYEELRRQYEHSVFKKMVRETCGEVCCNCHSTESIEYHHVVPLKVGGTNNLSNIIALCHRCHCAAHSGQHIRDYQNKKISGRPRKAENGVIESAIVAFVNGKIGTSECKNRIGLSRKTKIGDASYYKKYLKDHGIKSVRNNVDIITVKRGYLSPGEVVGYVKYEDGSEKPLIW